MDTPIALKTRSHHYYLKKIYLVNVSSVISDLKAVV